MKNYIHFQSLSQFPISNLVTEAHAVASSKGFWENTDINDPTVFSSKVSLIFCELAEAIEAARNSTRKEESVSGTKPQIELAVPIELPETISDDELKAMYLKNYKGTIEEELADTAIRLFDLAGALKIDLSKHIALKMLFNLHRPHKHGKVF